MKDRHRRALRHGNTAKLEIVKLLHSLAHSRRLYDVWCDFISAAAIAISNRVDLIRAPKREEEYMRIAKRYNRDELNAFARSLALLRLAYVDSGNDPLPVFDDVLGEIYMTLELGNDNAGQFFTPMEVCRLMSRLTFDVPGVHAAIESTGYVSVMDPAIGAGAMVLAFAETMHAQGLDYRRNLVVTGVDISLVTAQMAYLQCALLDIPAVIVHGNSLSLEEYCAWLTPAYVANGHATRDVLERRTKYLVDTQEQHTDHDTRAQRAVNETVNLARALAVFSTLATPDGHPVEQDCAAFANLTGEAPASTIEPVNLAKWAEPTAESTAGDEDEHLPEPERM
jgi:hypothetical protein